MFGCSSDNIRINYSPILAHTLSICCCLFAFQLSFHSAAHLRRFLHTIVFKFFGTAGINSSARTADSWLRRHENFNHFIKRVVFPSRIRLEFHTKLNRLPLLSMSLHRSIFVTRTSPHAPNRLTAQTVNWRDCTGVSNISINRFILGDWRPEKFQIHGALPHMHGDQIGLHYLIVSDLLYEMVYSVYGYFK